MLGLAAFRKIDPKKRAAVIRFAPPQLGAHKKEEKKEGQLHLPQESKQPVRNLPADYEEKMQKFHTLQKKYWERDLKEMDEEYIVEHSVRLEKALLLTSEEMIDKIIQRRMSPSSVAQQDFVRIILLVLETMYGRFGLKSAMHQSCMKKLDELFYMNQEKLTPEIKADLTVQAKNALRSLPYIILSAQQKAILDNEPSAVDRLNKVRQFITGLERNSIFLITEDESVPELLISAIDFFESHLNQYDQNFSSATAILEDIKTYILSKLKKPSGLLESMFPSEPLHALLVSVYQHILGIIQEPLPAAAASEQKGMEMKRL